MCDHQTIMFMGVARTDLFFLLCSYLFFGVSYLGNVGAWGCKQFQFSFLIWNCCYMGVQTVAY